MGRADIGAAEFQAVELPSLTLVDVSGITAALYREPTYFSRLAFSLGQQSRFCAWFAAQGVKGSRSMNTTAYQIARSNSPKK